MSTKPPKVFLSHSGRDKLVARQVTDAMREAGIEVWLDDDDLRPGEDVAYRIREAIDDADSVVFLVSPEWTRSAYANLELAAAVARDLAGEPITIIPVVTEKEFRLPPLLTDYAHLNVAGTLSKDALESLIQSVRRERRRPPREAAQLAKREELVQMSAALRAVQAAEHERALSRERSLRSTWAITIALSLLLVVVIVVTRSLETAAFLAAPLTGVLAAAVGFYLGRRDER